MIMWALSTGTDFTAAMLFMAIIFPQTPHFSLVQGDVIVDPEVVQPVVVTFRIDLGKRT